MSARPLWLCVLSLMEASGCSCSDLSRRLDDQREETSQIPSKAPNPHSKPPLTGPRFASIDFTALALLQSSSFQTLFDTNAEHHPRSLLPVQPGAGRGSGARVQTGVNRKWLFSQAPRSWPPSPIAFSFLCPLTRSPLDHVASLLLPDLLAGSSFSPLCHVKQRRFVSGWPQRTSQSFLWEKKGKYLCLSLVLGPKKPIILIPPVHKMKHCVLLTETSFNKMTRKMQNNIYVWFCGNAGNN